MGVAAWVRRTGLSLQHFLGLAHNWPSSLVGAAGTQKIVDQCHCCRTIDELAVIFNHGCASCGVKTTDKTNRLCATAQSRA